MEIKVTILDDNIAGPPLFKAEHGLSVLVEVDGRGFLWDCGQTDIAVQNARALGIDLRSLEGIGISHGHYDHAGGLMSVLAASGPKKVYMHPECFAPKYFMAGQMKRFIGVPFSREAIVGSSSGLELNRGPVEVMPGVFLTGEIPRVTEFEGHPEPNLYVMDDGKPVPDPFTEDQALVVSSPRGAVVLTGCAHCGVVNILKHVKEEYGEVIAVVGGTHLGLGNEARVEPTIEFLKGLSARMVFTHCTGTRSICRIMSSFPESFTPGQTGLMLTL